MINNNSIEFYDKLFAKTPKRWDEVNIIITNLYNMINRFCTEDKVYKIIDLGCGTGTLFTLLDNKRFDCVGVDFSSEAIKCAKERNPHKEFVIGDMTNTQYDNHSFDIVLAIGSFEHLRNITFKEPRRLVKEDGLFLCVVPYSTNIGWIKNGVQNEWILSREKWIEHINSYGFNIDRNINKKWTLWCVPL